MLVVSFTFWRAFKFWWSLLWRMTVLTIPLIILSFPILYMLFPQAPAGGPPINPADIPGFAAKAFVLWGFTMVGSVCLHVVAVRWTLKAKWSDFRLLAVAPHEPIAPPKGELP